MTTIVIVRKGGRVAIGADSQLTRGMMQRNADYTIGFSKISRAGSNYIAIAGVAVWTHVIKHYMSRFDKLPPLRTPQEIYRFLRVAHFNFERAHHLRAGHSDFESSHIRWLLANPYGAFSIDVVRNVLEISRFDAYGSGDAFAMGAMFAVYDNPGITVEEIARIGLEAGCEFDVGSGGKLVIHTITLLTQLEKERDRHWRGWFKWHWHRLRRWAQRQWYRPPANEG